MSDFLNVFRPALLCLSAVVFFMAVGAGFEQQNIAKDCAKHGQFKADGNYFECKPK